LVRAAIDPPWSARSIHEALAGPSRPRDRFWRIGFFGIDPSGINFFRNRPIRRIKTHARIKKITR